MLSKREFTAAKFVRGPDVPLVTVQGYDNYVTDIIKLSDDSLLIAHCHSQVYTVSSKNRVDKEWQLNHFINSVTEVSKGSYVATQSQFSTFKNSSSGKSSTQAFSRDDLLLQMRLMDNYQVISKNDGNLLIKTVKGDPNTIKVKLGQTPNKRPRYVRLVKENGTPFIYTCGEISEATDQVTKLSMTGEILKVYNNWEFSNARSIATTGDGHVFVCFPEENSIHLIPPQMDRGVTVLDSSNGLEKPTAIYYCSDKRKLYVANNKDSKVIMTFDVKY